MKRNLTATLALTAAALVGNAAAQGKISAQSIIVNPTQPDLAVSVTVNKDASGNANPTYRIGEKITVSATVNRDAYVYLFNVNADGTTDQILPNRLGGDNFVKAGTTKTFPAPGDNFTFDIGGPVGQNKVLALASLTPLNLEQISQFRTAQDQFATVSARTQAGFAQALSIVVNPLPQNSWVSDTAFYNVVNQAPVSTGALFIGTNVDATVILNGQRLGGSNVTYANLRPGTYPVRIQAPGYNDFATTVTVRQGAVTNLNVDLTPTQPVYTTQPSTGNPILDLIGGLLGLNTQVSDPARSANDQKVADLQRQGYTLQGTRQTTTGYVSTLVKGGSTVTVTVTRGANRTLSVQVTETTTYRY
ncbi:MULTISPECIES: DUF4384 domain-containing protein [Deinococcus]|jgi:hypothetical protein|uniref:S-layer protein n=2 Tax=Deinococcus TaxID=1298 RepID=A0A221SST7_9DEIO|nr:MULTISPECIES: DUF4384 domain-containing protein [Deinococcus]ASN79709.1 S-layer protein [Deinococcus ficus]MDP9765312.1 hypothetical protein [Deinococcus enclensis]GHF86792.1 hypothetical protein GCM10017782_25140 [Deinococcus ficus]